MKQSYVPVQDHFPSLWDNWPTSAVSAFSLVLFFFSHPVVKLFWLFSPISLLPFSRRQHKMTHKSWCVIKWDKMSHKSWCIPYLPYVFRQTGLSKQWRPRWDAAECGVSSGSKLFATLSNFQTQHRLVNCTCSNFRTNMGRSCGVWILEVNTVVKQKLKTLTSLHWYAVC